MLSKTVSVSLIRESHHRAFLHFKDKHITFLSPRVSLCPTSGLCDFLELILCIKLMVNNLAKIWIEKMGYLCSRLLVRSSKLYLVSVLVDSMSSGKKWVICLANFFKIIFHIFPYFFFFTTMTQNLGSVSLTKQEHHHYFCMTQW